MFHLSLSWRESPPCSSALPNKPSEIPWLTAVPDGIITPRFHSQLAQDPPPVEVAVPLPCPRVNINTNIWQCYVILYLWGDMLRWSPNKFSFFLFVFMVVSSLCIYRNVHTEMCCKWHLEFWVQQNWLCLKIQSTCDENTIPGLCFD